MATIRRRSARSVVSAATALADADDLDGTVDNSQTLDVSGAGAVIILQHNNGTLGTAGIDVIELSKDGGSTWAADDTILALASDSFTGTILASAALNAAGVEPVNAALFKSGPHQGPTLMRCGRKTTTTGGTTWVTGAPTVSAFRVG